MNLLIIQARMGSTRLPGKVLMNIHGRPILETLLDRIKPSKTVQKIIVATTTNAEDDKIETFCKANGTDCYRGSDWDVLDRFYKAALPYKPNNIVRITSDCPLHSYKVVDFVVRVFASSGLDYVSNSNKEPDFLEDGFDTEVFTFAALETAWKEAKMLSEREHVTPYIKNSGKFKCGWQRYDVNYTYKLSVDSPNDFKTVERIFEELKSKKDFGMKEVIELMKEKPEIAQINKESIANSGYQKSLDNDKPIK